MKIETKLIFLFSLLAVLFIVVSCAPPDDGLTAEEKELLGEDKGAIAGQAISLGCGTPTIVSSCSDSGTSSLTVIMAGSRGLKTITVPDRCNTVRGTTTAIDFSCTSPTSFQFCRNQCESSEDCVTGRCISRCGNGVVDTGETCFSCPVDAGCIDGKVCQSGVCEAQVAPLQNTCEYLTCGNIATITEGESREIFDGAIQITPLSITAGSVEVQVETIEAERIIATTTATIDLGRSATITGIPVHVLAISPDSSGGVSSATLCISEAPEEGV